MSHSLTAVWEEPLEDYTDGGAFEPLAGHLYRIEASESLVAHTEILHDEDGEVIYEQSVPIDYAVGSGARGRSYLIDRDGLLFMSPITWYTQGQQFDLSPGYSPHSHPRFSRQISDGCLSCHSGIVRTDDTAPHRYAPRPFEEKSIGCERCHGPGREHIAFHRAENADPEIDPSRSDPIVNPAHLDPRLRDDICNQCHLQGVERVLRYGRNEFDFRPGDRLIDIWATFVSGTRIDASGNATQAVSQVEQMHASECFLKSGGQLTCTSCHDPHRSPSSQQKDDFFRQRCLACHDDGQSHCSVPLDERLTVENSCITCHMPRLGAKDVPHTSQTDHRVRRDPLARPRVPSAPVSARRPELFMDAESELSSEALQRVRGLFIAHTAENSSNVALARESLQLLAPLTGAFQHDEELLDALGSASYLVGELDSARQYWQQVLELQPARGSALEGLVLVTRRQKRQREALQYVNRLVELNPWQERFHRHKAQILDDLGRHSEGIAAAETGLEFHPGSIPLHRWLTEACREAGQRQKAEDYQRKLERILSVTSTQRR